MTSAIEPETAVKEDLKPLPINGNENDGDESSEEEGGNVNAKKKKKKPKKKKKKALPVQSDPPRVGLLQFFAPESFPEGDIESYTDENLYRTTDEELRAKEREGMNDPESNFNYNSIRRAAEVHKQARTYARANIKPGMSLMSIANMIEDTVRALVDEDRENPQAAGIGFPTGLNINECAAHYSPNPGDKVMLSQHDVLKVDIGVQVGGRICDSAFTLNWEPEYNSLLEAVKDATNQAVRTAGIDVRLADIGAVVEEVMNSYEVTVPGVNKGMPMQVKPIRSLSGHNILPYQIHGGKSVPLTKDTDETQKMEEGETFAIETFGTTGSGWVDDMPNCSHYAKKPNVKKPLSLGVAKHLLNTINREFGTLPFCRRYLERAGEPTHALALRNLVDNGIVRAYPPLNDRPGSMTAQFEHTIILRPTCKEVVSRHAVDADY